MLGGARSLMRHSAVQCFEVLEEGSFKLAGKFAERRLSLTHAFDDFVFHVRDVHHVFDGVALELKVTADKITEYKGAPIPDVGEVVHRGSATVHTDASRRRIEWAKVLD